MPAPSKRLFLALFDKYDRFLYNARIGSSFPLIFVIGGIML
jgi:hypothetical protein